MENTFEYSAVFTEDAAKRAAMAFSWYSLVKLRLWNTVSPPLIFGAATFYCYYSKDHSWLLGVFGVFFLFSLFYPVALFVARPAAWAKAARKMPHRQVKITHAGITVAADGSEGTLPWKRFTHAWAGAGFVFLVISPYTCLNLPLEGMPEGAQEFMLEAVSAANAS